MPHILGELKSICKSLNERNISGLAVRVRKIAITTVSTKPVIEKLLTLSTKVVLMNDECNVNMKRYRFRTLVNKR